MKIQISRFKQNIAILSDIRQGFRLFCRFNKYIYRYWKFGLLLLILGNFSILLSLAEPYIGKNALDKGILLRNKGVFVIYVIWGIGIYAVNLIVDYSHRYLKNYTIRRVRIDLSRDVLKRIRKYSLGTFQNKSTGENIYRVTNDITGAANVINDTLPNLLTCIFKLILITIIIVLINWKFLALIVVYQLLVLFQVGLFIKRIGEMISLKLTKSEDIFKKLSEVFSHIYLVKAFGTIAKEGRKLLHNLIQQMRMEVSETNLRIVSGILQNTANKLFFGVIGFYGSLMVIQGELTPGSLAAIMLYITQGLAAYSSIINLGQQVVLNRIPLGRIASLFDVDIDLKENGHPEDAILDKGSIEFRKVTFGYKNDKHILENMNFCISSNTLIAMVGPSGCGKSTVLNLLLRLYDVNSGGIFFDGHDIRNLKFKSIYSQIGIACQQPFLWNDTAASNIAYGAKGVGQKEIIWAAKISEAHDFITALPGGYDTVVGEDACKISEGQKQRIAIARALIKRPKILILDEAMSSLDSQTEDKIIDNIKKEFTASTLIIVSHRFSTVRKMDLVYFLEGSACMDIGTHKELVERNMEYVKLFSGQTENI